MPPGARHAAAAAFVHEIAARVGAQNPRELSGLLGTSWTTPDQQRKLYKWWKGDQAPNFEGTLALLELAGLIREHEVWAGEKAPSRDPLLAIEATVAAQGEAMTQALHGLAADVRKLSRQLERQAPAATGKRAAR